MSQQTSLSLEFVRSCFEKREYKQLRLILKDYELADLAELFSQADSQERIILFRLVPRTRRADLFSYIDFDQQEAMLEELPDVFVSSLLNQMDPDDRTKLLEEVSDEIRAKLLLKLNPEERLVASKLLSYPEQSVGRLMTPDFLALTENMSVGQALEHIHWSNALPSEFLHFIFVTKSDGTLIGEVSLASLVVSDPPSQNIRTIMKRCFVALHPEEPESQCVEIFRKYDRQYIPVLDAEDKIIGIVTADDVFDIAEEEATEDIQQFGGHSALEDSYFNTPFFTMLSKRAGWLILLFVGGFLSGEALRSYQDVLTQWSFLMFFLPAIISAGGNSGTQAASLVIRELALSEMELRDVWRVLRREILIGLILGCALALFGFGRTLLWGLEFKVGLIVSLSVIAVVMSGVIFGSMLPFIFRKLKLDPAVVSSPFISTLVDFSGTMILINIAIYIMRHI